MSEKFCTNCKCSNVIRDSEDNFIEEAPLTLVRDEAGNLIGEWCRECVQAQEQYKVPRGKLRCAMCYRFINTDRWHSHKKRGCYERRQGVGAEPFPYVNALQAMRGDWSRVMADPRMFYTFTGGVFCRVGMVEGEADDTPATVAEFMKDARSAWSSLQEYERMCDRESREANDMYWDHMQREGAKYGIDVRRPGDECSRCGGGGCPMCEPENF